MLHFRHSIPLRLFRYFMPCVYADIFHAVYAIADADIYAAAVAAMPLIISIFFLSPLLMLFFFRHAYLAAIVAADAFAYVYAIERAFAHDIPAFDYYATYAIFAAYDATPHYYCFSPLLRFSHAISLRLMPPPLATPLLISCFSLSSYICLRRLRFSYACRCRFSLFSRYAACFATLFCLRHTPCCRHTRYFSPSFSRLLLLR